MSGFEERDTDGTEREDHCSPSFILERARQVGRIVFDPAPNLLSHVKPVWQTDWPAVSGLEINWRSLIELPDDFVWINPPYSRYHNKVWPLKFAHEAKQGTPMMALIAARTSEIWWHSHILGSLPTAILFFRGRLKHDVPDYEAGILKPGGTAKFPSALVTWNISKPGHFQDAFGDLGSIWWEPRP